MQTAVVHAGMSIPKASQPWAICIELATCSFGRGSLGLGACGALAGGYQSMSMLLDCCREGSREPGREAEEVYSAMELIVCCA